MMQTPGYYPQPVVSEGSVQVRTPQPVAVIYRAPPAIHVSPEHSALVCPRCGGMLVSDGGEVGISCLICARPYPPARAPDLMAPGPRPTAIGSERNKGPRLPYSGRVPRRMAELRKQGMTLSAIGAKYGVSRYTVSKRIKSVAGYGP